MHLKFLEPEARPNMDVVVITNTCQPHQPRHKRLSKQLSVHLVPLVSVSSVKTMTLCARHRLHAPVPMV